MLDLDDTYNIERLAAVMSLDEILDLYGVSASALTAEELESVREAWRRGRRQALLYAIERLQQHMAQTGTSGSNATIRYLAQAIESWKQQKQDSGKILVEFIDELSR